MSRGVPLISTHSGGLRDVEDCALKIQPESKRYRKQYTIISKSVQRREMSEKGKELKSF